MEKLQKSLDKQLKQYNDYEATVTKNYEDKTALSEQMLFGGRVQRKHFPKRVTQQQRDQMILQREETLKQEKQMLKDSILTEEEFERLH